MHGIEQTVREHIVGLGTPLLLTVSGGADSVALLHAVSRLGATAVVAHCNFHLRGDESNRDERFVRELCSQLGVMLFVEDFDVDSYCREKSVSVEMACRELRYAWFRELKEKIGASRILTAHNADDNIETLLLNLFRATGIEGLRGMQADTGEILRPLLSVTRKEIETYLSEIGVSHITDSTNLSSDYQRNFIRNELLPAIESRWHGVKKTIMRTQRNLAGVSAFYKVKVAELLGDNPNYLEFKNLYISPDRRTLIFEFLKSYGVNNEIVDEIECTLAKGGATGKYWEFRDYRVVVEREGLRVLTADSNFPDMPEMKTEILFCTEETIAEMKNNKVQTVAYISGNADDYELRRYRQGDRIFPLGMRGSRLVSDVVKDAKLNSEEKRRLVVLVERKSGKIVWIPGLKRSCYCLVGKDDVKMLKLTLCSHVKF